MWLEHYAARRCEDRYLHTPKVCGINPRLDSIVEGEGHIFGICVPIPTYLSEFR